MTATESTTTTAPRPRIVVRLAADGTLSTGAGATSVARRKAPNPRRPRQCPTIYDRFRARLANDLDCPNLDRQSVAGCTIRFLREHLQSTFRGSMWWTNRKGWVVSRINDVPHDHRNDRIAVSNAFRWDNLTTMDIKEWSAVTAERRWTQNHKRADAVLSSDEKDEKHGATITSTQLIRQKTVTT